MNVLKGYIVDTIFAVSSGLLPSGVAVIRISGPQVRLVVETLYGQLPKPRLMCYGNLTAKDGSFLDSALTVFFPSPHSFTGEDCAEFHIHGGKAVVSKFLDELSSFKDCRLAEAGEFSRRAFIEGKMDLTQAEGLADLIEAETESQRRLAVMGASGKLSELYRHWRKQLITARALIEAELDFSDEADIPGSVSDSVWVEMHDLASSITQHIKDGQRANTMRDGIKIVLAGAPNSGKSSIINRLTGRDVAIVTDEAGTTRDALEVRLVLSGMPVLITDTAGLRDTDNRIEQMGIEAAKLRVIEADLVIVVDDMNDPQFIKLPKTQADIWHVGNKSDIINDDQQAWTITFSAMTGLGFEKFVENIEKFCADKIADIGDAVPARKRQIDLLIESKTEIELALSLIELDLTLRAEHLRRAAETLGRITGDIDVEDLLDVIFSEFCVGK